MYAPFIREFFYQCNNGRSITFKFFDLETQNLNVRSITKTVLENKKNKFLQSFLKVLTTFSCRVLFRSKSFAKTEGLVTFLVHDLEG